MGKPVGAVSRPLSERIAVAEKRLASARAQAHAAEGRLERAELVFKWRAGICEELHVKVQRLKALERRGVA